MESFVQRMVVHLRTNFPDERVALGLADEDLEPLAKEGVAKARGYGIMNETDLQLYLECMLMLSPAFDEDRSWAGDILARADIAGNRKMGRISDYLAFGLRGEK